MRTLLICQEDSEIDREVIAPWLASFSSVAGLVLLREKPSRMKKRIRREIERVGYFRFLDVLAFRLYYSFTLAGKDAAWKRELIDSFAGKFGQADRVPELITHSPNSPEAEAFVRSHQPDIVVARCKTLLAKRVFSIANKGTFVFHPGICPEYRNAHGCFWAMANGDLQKVGMTLLKVDEGIDTGPVFGYYTYDYDPLTETHFQIQTKVVTENLLELKNKLIQVLGDEAQPMQISDRPSNVWGQPWLSKHWKIKRDAKARLELEFATRSDSKAD